MFDRVLRTADRNVDVRTMSRLNDYLAGGVDVRGRLHIGHACSRTYMPVHRRSSMRFIRELPLRCLILLCSVEILIARLRATELSLLKCRRDNVKE